MEEQRPSDRTLCRKGPGLFSYHGTSRHRLQWKEGSDFDFSSGRLPSGSDRSGCTVFPSSGRRFALFPSYFFEGIVTYMAPNIVAFKGRVEKHSGFESYSGQSSEGVHFYYCVWPLYSKNSELLLSCQQPVGGTDLETRNYPRKTSRELEEGPRPSASGWKTKGISSTLVIGLRFRGALVAVGAKMGAMLGIWVCCQA